MSLPWFRMYTEFLTDPLIRMLAFEDQRHFVAALCLKASGVLDKPYPTPEIRRSVIGQLMGLSIQKGQESISSLDAANARLQELGLVDDEWQPRNWEKRQFRSDRSDPTAAERMRRYRNSRNGAVTLRSSVTQVTALDTDTDTDTDKIGQTPSAFDRFWSVYPKKRAKKTACEMWKRKRLDPRVAELLRDVEERQKSDRRWLEGFIPDPTTYLNQERWTDEREPPKEGSHANGLPFAKL